MKAKELAALLLQTPDLEVYIEEYNAPDFDDGFYSTSGCCGITRTPDGIFIDTCSIDCYPKSPSDKPSVGAIAIMMTDGQWFKLRMDQHDLSVLVDYSECGYICNYISWDDLYFSLCPDDIQDSWVREHMEETGSTHYTPEDVDYVKVLVDIDPETWNPEYKHFTFDEAIAYALENK